MLMPVELAEEIQDLLHLAVLELQHERLARRRVERRLLHLLAGLLPHRLRGRLRPRRLDPVADGLLEALDLGRAGFLVRRLVLDHAAVLDQRQVELIRCS